ncbi:MAG: hypothetical protein HFI33_00875 [Lachnospiraceae bacterium]|nr:hypothetical protein [Lachnospiraceae bacterium]
MSIRNKILKIVNKPVKNIKSSQTLYEALLTSINLGKIYPCISYRQSAEKIALLIVESQLEDGGFDIGYNFQFGKGMKKKNKKESTSPEILSLYALIAYYEMYHDNRVVSAIDKAVEWIVNNSIEVDKNLWAIPYAPCSYREIHITNATSFAVAALAYYTKVFQNDIYKPIVNGMLTYMKEQLVLKEDYGYWNYFENELVNDPGYSKIDNYHIAQQLFYHMKVSEVYSNTDNVFIVEKVSRYLHFLLEESIKVPYTIVLGKKSQDIHIWGYCSLLSCECLLGEGEKAEALKDFIIEKFWNGNYFTPVINQDGKVLDNNYYPRSDAWVLHSLSEYIMFKDDKKIKDIVDKGLERLQNSQYCGLENHVITLRKKIFTKLVYMIRG